MSYNELISLGGNGIIDILTDDATATASQILSGYTAYVKGKKITGSIQSQNGQTITPMSSIQVIHTKDKYLTGDITVKGDSSLLAGNIRKGATIFGISGTYTSDANATAAYILSGKTAYVNGNKITGSMIDRRSVGKNGGIGISQSYPNVPLFIGSYPQTVQALDGNEYVAISTPEGCYNGIGTSYVGVKTDAVNLKAENIKAGTSIFGVSGTYVGTIRASCVIMSHQNYDYDDAAQWAINQSANIVTHVSTNKGVATFKFNIAAKMYIISTFFHYAETGSVGTCSLNGWVNTWVGQTFTISTIIGDPNAHGNNKRVIGAVSISY